MFFKKKNFRKIKLFLIPAVVVGFSAALIFIEFKTFKFQQESFVAFSKDQINLIQISKQLALFSSQHILMIQLLAKAGTEFDEEEIYENGRPILDKIERLKIKITPLFKNTYLQSKEPLDEIMRKIHNYSEFITSVVAISSVNLKLANNFMIEANKEFSLLHISFDNLLLSSGSRNQNKFNSMLENINKSTVQFGFSVILLVLIISLISLWLSRSIQSLSASREKLLLAKSDLEEKVEFLEMASHDMKAPLAIIQLASKSLNKIKTDREQRKLCEMISKQAERAIVLTSDLLEVSALETQELHIQKISINVKDLLIEMADDFRELAKEKGIGISVDEIESSLSVYADELRLEQVLRNLLSNAIKFSNKGTITMSAQEVAKDHEKFIAFSVKDEGRGIPNDKIGKIFIMFTQMSTEDRKRGMGLGLAICKKICEKHKGEIWVESEEGKGSKFTFIIPVSGSTMSKNAV
ncbi:MAG: HAMP domain-containing histidine kinase [Deltaproteobacteria bacterium]|nr:HAMP domain-containing histidine kinase [Deltaproteobacteria bacterium]